jgi:hypothetical protein
VQLGPGRKRLHGGDRGGALVDADLDRAPRGARELDEQRRLGRRVHRARRDQARAERQRAHTRVVLEAARSEAAQALGEEGAHA